MFNLFIDKTYLSYAWESGEENYLGSRKILTDAKYKGCMCSCSEIPQEFLLPKALLPVLIVF